MTCGIDFGTSNSTVAIAGGFGGVEMVRLEGEHTTIPSVIFFDLEEGEIVYGREAIQRFVSGYEGRLMRSLKGILGTSLVNESTLVGTKRIPFEDILVGFLSHIKDVAENQAHDELTHVVMGRPVHFVDNDPTGDMKAQSKLEQIARKAGFKNVRFQYEPIAAALAYENDLRSEELALIADIGGGTSDFSLIRLSPELRDNDDRSSDILANSGVRVGGTNLDRALSLEAVMPHLGMGTKTFDPLSKEEKGVIPPYVFVDLATWYKIHMLYTPKYARLVREIRSVAVERAMFARYAHVIDQETGHALAGQVEAAKIALSDAPTAQISLGKIVGEPGLEVEASIAEFEKSIGGELTKIRESVSRCLNDAGVKPEQISSVFLTGGSTAVPIVRQTICEGLQHSRVVAGEKFNSVGRGLGLEAGRHSKEMGIADS